MTSGQPIFSVTNHHVPGTHQPPTITDASGTYRSYFEYGASEQAIFVFDRQTGKAMLYHGDHDWVPDEVVNGQPRSALLGRAEQLWLSACWEASH